MKDEEEIRKKAKQEVEEIWEKELKKTFDKEIQDCLKETLDSLRRDLNKFDSALNDHIEGLDKNFEEKWNKKFKEEMSQIEEFQKKNNNNDDQDRFNVNNNNDNEDRFNLINNDDEEDVFNLINNKEDKNYINDYKKEDDETDDVLRKKQINLNGLNNPPLINLNMDPNSNSLINIALFCLINLEEIVKYYLNPNKEEKILKKAKENPFNPYLGPSFLKLLDHFWKSSKNEYSTSEIHIALKQLMLNKYNTNDLGEIFDFILTKLNEEIIVKQAINKEPEDVIDYFNQDKILQLYLDNFQNNRTIISDTFYSTFKLRKKCDMYLEDRIFFEGSPVINIYLEANNDPIFNNN